MQTYSETRGEQPFDWRAFLNQETISDDDAEAAKLRAKEWVTCACGNQCSIIPRRSCGTPHDHTLQDLGGDRGFFGAVKSKNWEEAIQFLDLIEVRSAYLIRKETENFKKDLVKSIELARSLGINIATLIK